MVNLGKSPESNFRDLNTGPSKYVAARSGHVSINLDAGEWVWIEVGVTWWEGIETLWGVKGEGGKESNKMGNVVCGEFGKVGEG